MSNQPCPDLDSFTAACTAAGITTVIAACRSEWGPPGIGEPKIDYGPQREVRLLAYNQGTIISHDGNDAETIIAELEAAGFTVERRSRNIARFGEG